MSTGTKSAGLRENFSAQIDFTHLHVYRDTFQNVREITDKLKATNKKIIDLSKTGEATEQLEMYVSAFLSMKWTPSCWLSKILYENLMSNNFRKTCIHLLGGDTVTSMTGISFNLNFIPIKGYKLDFNHTILISQ